MSPDRTGDEFIESVGIVQSRTVDIYDRTLRGVNGCQHDIGRVFSTSDYHIGIRDDVCVKLVDTHVADIDICYQTRQSLRLGLADVVLELCKQSDSRDSRHILKHLLLPHDRADLAGTVDHLSREHLGNRDFLSGISHKSCDIIAERLQVASQSASPRSGGTEHRDRCRLKIVVILYIMVVAILAVGGDSYGSLEILDPVVEGFGALAQLDAPVIPHSGFLRIASVNILKIAELHFIAGRHVEIGAVYTVLHLTETVEHIARHVEREHRREDDIHKVDHPLSRRHARHIITTSGHCL